MLEAVSLVGMVALLGLAWLMSSARRKVRLRTVGWGLGLQFTFAVVVLRDDAWSFVAMAALGLLVVAYLLEEGGGGAGRWRTAPAPRSGWGSATATLLKDGGV